jgi:hypothetical protein
VNPWRNWDAQRKAARAYRLRLVRLRMVRQFMVEAPEIVDRRIDDLELQFRDTPSSTE